MDQQQIYDIAVVGGGINGCGIARDAAGRGLQVFLAEQADLAHGTSSSSTKLIHGGLRYLEFYEFRLVRESLIEREVLLNNAPHIIWPLRFVLPHHRDLRPAWLLRLGLFLYDHLGGRRLLPGTRSVDLRKDTAGKPLVETFRKGFEYSDCWVDDARLVVLNAMDAEQRGARIATRSRVTAAERRGAVWEVTLENTVTGSMSSITARALVNATGPWVDEVIHNAVPHSEAARKSNVRLVRGSHIVVPRMFDHERAYIFQNRDGRIFFAIPYEQDFTLIGTTDSEHGVSLDDIQATEEEIGYLCEASSEYFLRPIRREDVIWSYAGVRPLYDDGASKAQEATRDYVFKLETEQGKAPLLNVFGGKITTYRRLSKAALARLAPYIAMPDSDWTAHAPLPGGDFVATEGEKLRNDLQVRYPFLDATTLERMARSYGTLTEQVLGNAQSWQDLGQDFGAGLTECELRYLVEKEYARMLDDVIWRRSKLGLRLVEQQKNAIHTWLQAHPPADSHNADAA